MNYAKLYGNYSAFSTATKGQGRIEDLFQLYLRMKCATRGGKVWGLCERVACAHGR